MVAALRKAADLTVLAWLKRYRYWLVVPAVLLVAVVAWRYSPIVRVHISDPTVVEALALRLGWFGPFALWR